MNARWRRIPGLLAAAIVALSSPALAHHILGIPHYAYDEQYPQTPILTYKQDFGPHEITMTGYPGKPSPGEQCAYNVYITRLDNGEPFDGTVTLTVFRDRMIGTDPVIYGPAEARLDQAVYKFYPRFEAEANYTARIEFTAEGAPWTVDLPVVVGEPGSPFGVFAAVTGGLLLFVVAIRAVRIKLRRRSQAQRPPASAADEPLTIRAVTGGDGR